MRKCTARMYIYFLSVQLPERQVMDLCRGGEVFSTPGLPLVIACVGPDWPRTTTSPKSLAAALV